MASLDISRPGLVPGDSARAGPRGLRPRRWLDRIGNTSRPLRLPALLRRYRRGTAPRAFPGAVPALATALRYGALSDLRIRSPRHTATVSGMRDDSGLAKRDGAMKQFGRWLFNI